MSLQYCEDCDKMIDLDVEDQHECFIKEEQDTILQQVVSEELMKGGKNDRKND